VVIEVFNKVNITHASANTMTLSYMHCTKNCSAVWKNAELATVGSNRCFLNLSEAAWKNDGVCGKKYRKNCAELCGSHTNFCEISLAIGDLSARTCRMFVTCAP